MKKFVFLMLLTFASFFNSAQATVIGDTSDHNAVQNSCYPFACAIGAGTYQQLYSYKDFDGKMNIGSLMFDANYSGDSIYSPNVSDGVFTVTLSTVDKLAFPTSLNHFGGQSNVQVVYQGKLPAMKDWYSLQINLQDTYFYDPSLEQNLVMQVDWTDANVAYNTPTFVNGTGTWGRLDSINVPSFNHDYGLVTHFSDVPEPGSLALIGLGMFGLFGLRRRSAK
jgi:hypothetical protein